MLTLSTGTDPVPVGTKAACAIGTMPACANWHTLHQAVPSRPMILNTTKVDQAIDSGRSASFIKEILVARRNNPRPGGSDIPLAMVRKRAASRSRSRKRAVSRSSGSSSSGRSSPSRSRSGSRAGVAFCRRSARAFRSDYSSDSLR